MTRHRSLVARAAVDTFHCSDCCRPGTSSRRPWVPSRQPCRQPLSAAAPARRPVMVTGGSESQCSVSWDAVRPPSSTTRQCSHCHRRRPTSGRNATQSLPLQPTDNLRYWHTRKFSFESRFRKKLAKKLARIEHVLIVTVYFKRRKIDKRMHDTRARFLLKVNFERKLSSMLLPIAAFVLKGTLNSNQPISWHNTEETKLIFKNCSYACAYHCAQLSYTTHHRIVLIMKGKATIKTAY